MPREEMTVESLGLGYVRVTLVIHSNVAPFHVKGNEAIKRIAKFVLNFTAGMLPCCKLALLKHLQEMPDDDPTQDQAKPTTKPPVTH